MNCNFVFTVILHVQVVTELLTPSVFHLNLILCLAYGVIIRIIQ